MNVLYKYCDQLGVVKILESLELKLPNISQVNDPLECLPVFYCPNDKSAIEARYLFALKCKNMLPSADYKQKLNEQLEKGEMPKKLAENSRRLQDDWNRKSCLLSVSKTARNTVMWAHYADKHKGVVIGIDFDSVFHKKKGIQMSPVEYSEQRPKINILTDFKGSPKAFLNAILTKSAEWKYEQEFRAVVSNAELMASKQQGLVCLKDFNGQQTWFLRLNPESIREIIFGLYTEESLKLAIKKLIDRPELQHVKLYQAEESETYTLNLSNIA
jgi:hypothetical protein